MEWITSRAFLNAVSLDGLLFLTLHCLMFRWSHMSLDSEYTAIRTIVNCICPTMLSQFRKLWKTVVVDCIAEMDRCMSTNRLKVNTDKTQFHLARKSPSASEGRTGLHSIKFRLGSDQVVSQQPWTGCSDSQLSSSGACPPCLSFQLIRAASEHTRVDEGHLRSRHRSSLYKAFSQLQTWI